MPSPSENSTAEDRQLNQLIIETSNLQREVAQVDGSLPTTATKLEDAALPAGSALIVGLLAFFGIWRQTHDTKIISRDVRQQDRLLNRWKETLEIIKGYQDITNKAADTLTALRAGKLAVNEPEEEQLQQLRDDAVGAVRRLRILGTSLSALGIEAALFEQYAKAATAFIAASRGSDAGLLEESYTRAVNASESLNSAVSRVAETLGNRIAELDKELAPATTASAS